MDRGAWRATVHRAAKSQTQLKQLSMHACSHPYMTTGKTIALRIQTFVGKVMSFFFLICCLGLSKLSFKGANIF